MNKKIQAKIQKAQIQAEFGIEILPHRRGKQKAAREGYVKRFQRNENLDVLDKDGNLILSKIHVEHTMTPKEQYLKSTRNPYRKENS